MSNRREKIYRKIRYKQKVPVAQRHKFCYAEREITICRAAFQVCRREKRRFTMELLRRISRMQPLSYEVLRACVLLTCALLASALVVLVWAGDYTYETVRLYFYAEHICDMALIVLGTGLIGSALLEDVLLGGMR